MTANSSGLDFIAGALFRLLLAIGVLFLLLPVIVAVPEAESGFSLTPSIRSAQVDFERC